jgi:DNA-binding CsgD family transcriptional regulator
MYRYLLLLFSIFFAAFTQAQQLGLPFSKFYSSQEYQGGIQNFQISQSASGLVYVANNFGLLEYDGTDWRRYSLPNSTKIRSIYIDSEEKIFASGQGEFGYFYPGENGYLAFQSLINKLPENIRSLDEIWKIFHIHQSLIFCTVNSIFVFSENLDLNYTLESLSSFETFHVSNNQLFIQDREQGLLKLENSDLVQVDKKNFFRDKTITGILNLVQGKNLIFTRDQGAFVHDEQSTLPWSAIKNQQIQQINQVRRLKNGEIAIGTQNDGVYILSDTGEQLLHMDKNTGMQNNTILSIFEDVSGNLWLGHNNGISLLEMSLPFRLIDQFSELTGTGYYAMVSDGQAYYGTNNGLFVQDLQRNTGIKFIPKSEGQVYQVKNIYNHILLAHNDGAFEIKNGIANQLTDIQGVWNFLPLKEKPGYILSGTYSGLIVFKKEGDKVNFSHQVEGFQESSRIMQQDNEGNIWMTHGYKGVYKIKLSEDLKSAEVSFYGVEKGLPTNLLISVWQVNDRLVFTTEYGVYTYNSETDRFEKDPFFIDYFGTEFLVTSLIEDPIGNIFYIGENEAGVLENQINGAFVKNHQIFNKIIPFLNDDLQNVSLLGSNEALFAANEGFIWYKLERNKRTSASSFPTLIRAVYLTGLADSLINLRKNPIQNSYESSDPSLYKHQFDYGSANIRFEFTNPIPNQENTTLFQTWLEGLDEDFGEWSTKREKAFTNLREGSYTFHVRSRNIYGQLSSEDTFSFEVFPPWYRSIWAYLCYFVFAMVILYSTFKYVDKRYQKKTKAITAKQKEVIEAKESALINSKEEIERLKTEKLQAEIQSKNKELASATMHLLNKNGFIDHTKNQLGTIVKKSKNQEVKNEIQKVIHNIDRNIAGDKDWEQFEIHFDQVHGDFMSRFKSEFSNLSPQEIKLSAYLRMNLSSKEIAYLMNISTRGVEISRYRLRKKLELQRSENLQEFILKF